METASFVRSYHHVYKEIWGAPVGEILEGDIETRNAVDRYAMAVMKDKSVIGHLPRSVVFVHFVYGEEESFVDVIISR